MKRRKFLSGILPALLTAKALAEIIKEDTPKHVGVQDPCNPKKGEVWDESGKWSPRGPVPEGCVPGTRNPSYDPKTGSITYIDPKGFTI